MKKKIAILATNGFEEVELTSPKEALEKEGWSTEIVSPKSGSIKAWASTDWGKLYPVDKTLEEVHASDYNALLLPGGVINPDQLRTHEKALEFVKAFFEAGKPVAAICHGPQTLISADVVDGRKMTSYPSIKQDLINAGAEWHDKEVVVDKGLVTSRNPDDLPAFNKKMIEEIKEGKHEPVL
ncbi:MAG: protease [Flavobacterium sp.]|uniref:type 1 glutamine amidotransferase domain-containing protein n=1 Tax=unclassified Flavobacterium TaxID=196869 RepID=UPI000C3B928D|nr:MULTISPECIES: type 1 glutamine amidotransferase domain-containing protein [unclassified Flavobacterium]MBF03684.1 protease [Flavobacterium sp.]MCO6163604.1 type 1 glutamine amidotransferase [Flavobacterium sp. NRK F7]|tara:strand:+ start:405 stop:950 length:546 start_codon:yes stop_codon:yes gene_type:complete